MKTDPDEYNSSILEMLNQASEFSKMDDFDRSIELCIKAGSVLGIRISKEPSLLALKKECFLLRWNLFYRPLDSLAQLPPATSSQAKQIMMVLQELANSCLLAGNIKLLHLSVLKHLNLALKYGYIDGAAFCFALFGMMLNYSIPHLSNKYGEAALSLITKYREDKSVSQVCYLCGAMIFGWSKERKTQAQELLVRGAEKGPLLRNLSYMSHCYLQLLLFDMDHPINSTLTKGNQYLKIIKKTPCLEVWNIAKLYLQSLANLADKTASTDSFSDDEFQEDVFLDEMKSNDCKTCLSIYDFFKAINCYRYGKNGLSVEHLKRFKGIPQLYQGAVWNIQFCLYSFLIYAAVYSGSSKIEKTKIWKKLQLEYRKMKKWNKNNPENFSSFLFLMEAELARLSGKKQLAAGLYDNAIKAANRDESLQLMALIHELAARFYFEDQKEVIARIYFLDAILYYERWGAIRKVKALQNEFPILLPASLLPARASALQDLSSEKRNLLKDTTTESLGVGTLDFISVIKASQAIAGEIHFKMLIAQIMRVVIENAGAQHGYFLIPTDGNYEIAAYSDSNGVVEPPVQAVSELPMSIIHHVVAAKKPIVLGIAYAEGNYMHDPYVESKHPVSILCQPIFSQDELRGILYLENNLAKNAFTHHRIMLLEVLSTQIAISIDNASFYEQLEKKIEARTKLLKETQQQLVQKEKMVSLGLLTKGIAHEISNPLNFVINFGELIKEEMNVLTEHLKNCEESNLNHSQIAIIASNIQNRIATILTNGKRISTIIKRMNEHIADTSGEFMESDIHQLILDCIDIKSKEYSQLHPEFAMRIETSFDLEGGMIPISPRDLKRVFLNLLDNSFHASFQKWQGNQKTYEPSIHISSVNCLSTFEIRIHDNGEGIASKNMSKLLTPFFTTKPAIQGNVGLGVFLSHHIITQQHSGSMSIQSVEGEYTEVLIILPFR